MNHRCAFIAVSLMALSSAEAQLTPADSARLRAEIASALLEFEWQYSRPVTFRFGQAGGNIPDSLVPPGFRILGGTGVSTLLLESPQEAPDAERTIREHVLTKGLRLFEPRQFGREEGFVFRQASSGASGLQPRQYCSGSNLFRVNVRPQWPAKGTGSVVYLRYSGNYAPCSPEAAQQPELTDDEPTLDMPILRPPPGATSNGSGMSGGGGSGSYQRTARAEVRSEMSTRDIMLFYAAQLTEQGWTVGEPAIVAEAAIVAARKTDKEGRDLQGVLADVKSPQGMHNMTFQIDRASTRRRRP